MKDKRWKWKVFFSGAVLGLLLVVSCKKETTIPDASNVVEKPEETFIEDVYYQEDIAEILADQADFDLFQMELYKLALKKTKNSEVRGMAQILYDQNVQALTQLKKIAEKNEVVLPVAISVEKNDELIKLSKSDSADFDRNFLNTVLQEQTDGIDQLTAISQEITDTEIKDWVLKTLVLLKKQQAEAALIKASVLR